MSTIELAAVGGVILLFGSALLLVRRDYRVGGTLAGPTVVIVWAAYLWHAGATAWFAWAAPLGRIGLPANAAGLLGALLTTAGVLMAGLAIATFRSFERMSGLENSRLIDHDVYGYSRNPQNLGWGLALLGFAVAGRSPSALALVILFGIVIHGYIVALEEPYLESVYGDEFRRYCRHVPRYLGTPRL